MILRHMKENIHGSSSNSLKGKDMRKRIDTYNIEGTTIEVEIMTTRKDVLDWLDQYIENLDDEQFDATDESFEIIYKDGTTEYIGSDYEGEKIRRNNIKSILYNNPCDYIVYGEYEMNEYGVAHAV